MCAGCVESEGCFVCIINGNNNNLKILTFLTRLSLSDAGRQDGEKAAVRAVFRVVREELRSL